MALKQRIDADLKRSLLSGQRHDAETLRGLKAALINEEVAQGKRETGLDDSAIERVVAKEVKNRQDSAKIYADAGRDELAQAETQEAELLSRYLPAKVSDDTIKTTIAELAEAMSISDIKGMGKLIGAVRAKLGNGADGGTIARLVKEYLSK